MGILGNTLGLWISVKASWGTLRLELGFREMIIRVPGGQRCEGVLGNSTGVN